MASRGKKSATSTSGQPNNLIELAKAIVDEANGKSGATSGEKTENKKFGEFAKLVADMVTDNTDKKTKTSFRGSSGAKDFQSETISLLRKIEETVRKNDLPKFLESKLGGILQDVHQKNVEFDENRTDNRANKQDSKQKELIDALKELKTASPNIKQQNPNNENNEDGSKQGGGLLSKVGGLIAGGVAGIGTMIAGIAGSAIGGQLLYRLTGGENPNEIQSIGRGGSKFALRLGGKKLAQLSSKLGTKRFGALRELAKSPASKIIRESTKKMTKMLPKGGAAGKLLSPAKKVFTKVGKISGIGKAIGRTGIKGVAKAGKLAAKAKWLGKAAKLSKFGGKLLPGVGTALSVFEAVGHIKNGNYGRAALSGISAVGSLIPGVGSIVAGVADGIGMGWDVFSAWKRRKQRKQAEQEEAVKKENKQQKETVKQMTDKAVSKTELKDTDKSKSDKVGAMASKIDAEIKKSDNTQSKKSNKALDVAKTVASWTPVGLAVRAWKNREKIGDAAKTVAKWTPLGMAVRGFKNRKALGQMAKKALSTKTGSIVKKVAKYGTLPGLAYTIGKHVAPILTKKSQTESIIKPENKPTVTAIKDKPQISQQQKPAESESSKLGDIVTDQLTKTRDADAAQTKDITETFKAELEKVCAMLAQINAVLPALQPIAPPPVQTVMEGNKIPEFRKRSMEAIA